MTYSLRAGCPASSVEAARRDQGLDSPSVIWDFLIPDELDVSSSLPDALAQLAGYRLICVQQLSSARVRLWRAGGARSSGILWCGVNGRPSSAPIADGPTFGASLGRRPASAYVCRIVVSPALRRGIAADHARQAASWTLWIEDLDDESPPGQLRLGFDTQGRLLETVVLVFDSGNELVIHARKARPKMLDLLP